MKKQASRSESHFSIELPLILFILTLALIGCWVLWFSINVNEYWEDSYSYLLSARRGASEGFSSMFGRIQHPLFAFLLYAATVILGDSFVAGKFLSILSLGTTLLFLYRTGRLVLGQTESVLILFFCVFVSVDYINFSLAVLSEPLFTALVVSSFYYLMKERYWVSFLILGLGGVVRAEYVLVLAAYVGITWCFGGLKKAATVSLLSLPFVVGVLNIVLNSPSAVKQVAARFGDRSFLKVADQAIMKFGHILVGGVPSLEFVILAIFVCAFLPVVGVNVERLRRGSEIDLADKVLLAAIFVVLSNLGCLILLNYLGYHPLAVRHFGYLVPFVALAFPLLTRRGLSLAAENSLGASTIVSALVIVAVATANHAPNSLNPAGRFSTLYHYMDGLRETGHWIRDNVPDGERFISPLPSVIFFSGKEKSSWSMAYPDPLLNRDSFLAENVRYVVWSDIWAAGNLKARETLSWLSTANDFLFFKHVFSPHKQKGWRSLVYRIAGREEGPTNTVAARWGRGWYGQERWGRWAKSNETTIELFSQDSRRVTLLIRAGSFHKTTALSISLNGEGLGIYQVETILGNNPTPTSISVSTTLQEGRSVLRLRGPDEAFRPSDIGAWKDEREIRFGIGEVVVDNDRVL